MSRKYLILIILFSIFSITLLGEYLTGLASYPGVKEVDAKHALEDVANGKEKVGLTIQDNKTCYWITGTMNKSNYLLQVNIVENSGDGCAGIVKEKKYIIVDRPFNFYGKSCFCGPGEYTIESKKMGKTSQIKVSELKPSLIRRRL